MRKLQSIQNNFTTMTSAQATLYTQYLTTKINILIEDYVVLSILWDLLYLLSIDASGGKAGLLKPPECHHMGGGVWPSRYVTFILYVVAEKA